MSASVRRRSAGSGEVRGLKVDGLEPDETLAQESPYTVWDLTTPQISSRSRLYSLEPVGVGTGFVESLPGYLSRLAEAHRVRLSMLVARVCAPELDSAALRIPGNCGLSTLWTSARAMHGTQKVARDWVSLLERLTGRQDLRCLTWLGWAHAIDAKHLIRATRAWCPACYADWRSQGTVVYEPLLWAAAPYGIALAIRCGSWTAVRQPIADGPASCGLAPAPDRAIVRGVAAGSATRRGPTLGNDINDRTRLDDRTCGGRMPWASCWRSHPVRTRCRGAMACETC